MRVQSVLFSKKKFSISKAKEWLKKNDFKIPQVHETEKYYRFRQTKPLKGNLYTTSKGKNGIKMVFMESF